MERDGRIVLCDMEAGAGTLLRLQPGQVDLVLVVAERSAKSTEVARRLAEIASARASVMVVANRVRDEDDLREMKSVLAGYELVVVPEEPAIERADREGVAPIDADPDAPGVRALTALAKRLAAAAP